MAHIAGYLYGFGLAFTLLALGIVKREEFDVFFLFKQARRRAAFRAASQGRTGGLWESASADTQRELARNPRRREPLSRAERDYAAARTSITDLVTRHDLAAAAAGYCALLERQPAAILPESAQLDVANRLHADDDHDHAATAYELFLKHYPRGPQAAEVRLILGLLYARRLARPERAAVLLAEARDRLTDADHRALADRLLGELET